MAANFFQKARTIACIGRNYADHVAELKNKAPKEPFFFLKPPSSLIRSGEKVQVPKGISCHHEVELALVVGSRLRDLPSNLSLSDSLKHIGGYALVIDFTARNMQETVKKAGLPWTAVKGFDTFLPVSDFISPSLVPDPENLVLQLEVNGKLRQKAMTNQMIFKIPRLLSHISSIMTLNEGDLVLTGTPAGVASVQHGDKIRACLWDASGQGAGGSERDGQMESGVLGEIDVEVEDRQGGYVFTE